MNFWYEGWMVTSDCMLFSAGCVKKTEFIASFLFIHYTGLTRYQYNYVFRCFFKQAGHWAAEKTLFGCAFHGKEPIYCDGVARSFRVWEAPTLRKYIESLSHLKTAEFHSTKTPQTEISFCRNEMCISQFFGTSGWIWLLELNSDSQNGFWRQPKKILMSKKKIYRYFRAKIWRTVQNVCFHKSCILHAEVLFSSKK